MADQIRTGLDWEDARFFIALARRGSLSATARALSVSHATVARRISSLERTLCQKLVERRPNGYVLTSEGTRALAAVNDMEAAAASLSRAGAEDAPKGLVRINTTPGLARTFVIPRIAGLVAQHSSLDVEVASNARHVSLERREADIALRFGRPQDGDLIAKHLVTFGYGFYASAEWRRRISEGNAPVFVGFDESRAYIPDAIWLAQHFPRARVALRTSDQVAQAVAARADAGIALLSHFVGRLDDQLGRCLVNYAPPSRELWLVIRRLDIKDVAVKTVLDFLVQLSRGARDFEERQAGN
jgi:DNA-binding transcriptional LysR family regulator